jgi:hypothetical protein
MLLCNTAEMAMEVNRKILFSHAGDYIQFSIEL